MAQRYPIPARRHRVEEEIRRSRFITTVDYAPTVEAARAFIQEVRAEFPDATHNVWAYVVGPPGSTARAGYSDDGEPYGTAGRPAWTVLVHSGVGDIVAVVTRYFGGTKLGKGGLVKAYSDGVKLALETWPLAEHRGTTDLEVVIPYTFVTPLQRMLPDYEAEVLAEVYGADVSYRLRLPEEQVAPFTETLIGLTNGAALVGPVEEDHGE
jgi:uncharacterized YigZ family protein